MKRLLEFDAQTGTSVFHHYDDLTDTTVIEEVQDVQPYIERNKRIQNMDAGGAKGLSEYSRKGIKDSWWHVASIPNGVAMKWLKEDGINIYDENHWPRVKKKLNDPDYKYLRTGTGRV